MWVVLLYDFVGVMVLGISSMVYEVASCDAVFGRNNFSLGSHSGDPCDGRDIVYGRDIPVTLPFINFINKSRRLQEVSS
jgi:hypothetical protein